MEEFKLVQEDISYVRDLVSRLERDRSPAAIYLTWAVISLIGFPLADFAADYVGFYWMVMGPAGFIISSIFAWRHSTRIGQENRSLGIRHSLHWIATLAAVFLVAPLGVRGVVEWSEVQQVILLILALSYFLAGVHLERRILWVGPLVTCAYVALFYITAYEWTLVGIIVAMGLAVAGLSKGRPHVEESI